MKAAFVFPGQGSQKAGMGKAWADASPAARETFAEADRVLGFALSRLCWEGPEEELAKTANTQPALLATSIAVLRALAEQPGLQLAPVAMAGHSLGEYSALVAADSLAFADALRLVRRRGELMQAAVPLGEGAMAAILGLPPEAVAEIAAEAEAAGEAELETAAGLTAGRHPKHAAEPSGEEPPKASPGRPGGSRDVCAVANLNAPGQTVIAGHTRAVERAVGLARQRGARKAMRLPVSAPFHSPLMRPAREAMAELLAATDFRAPRVPVVSNVDALPLATGEAARDALVRQIDSPVRWVESVEWMAARAGVELFLEIGAGGVLSALNRRIAPATRSASLADPEQLARWQGQESSRAAAGRAGEA